jgi:hypothetical protein
VLTASTVAADSAGSGGGIASAGGALTLTACALYYNGATQGGAIYNDAGALTVSNCTLSNNAADGDGGGVWAGGDPAGAVTLTNVTVSANSAGRSGAGHGGGLFVTGVVRPLVFNTLVAGNFSVTGPVVYDDVFGALDGGGASNLIGDGTGLTGLSLLTNQVGNSRFPSDPLLGPLQDNGGPTLTRALAARSPARGQGNSEYTDLGTDQRGQPRVDDGLVDVGAYQT